MTGSEYKALKQKIVGIEQKLSELDNEIKDFWHISMKLSRARKAVPFERVQVQNKLKQLRLRRAPLNAELRRLRRKLASYDSSYVQ